MDRCAPRRRPGTTLAERPLHKRRVNALLRMERRAKAEAGLSAGRQPGAPRRRRRRRIGVLRAAPSPTRPAAFRFLDSRGASSGTPREGRALCRLPASPAPAHLGEARRRAVRPALPREEETLRSRPGRDVQAAHLEEDARDGRGRARARERRAAARGVPPEKRHQRLTRTRRANRRARASGRRRAHGDGCIGARRRSDAFFSGRRLGEAGEARGLVRARDQSLARH